MPPFTPDPLSPSCSGSKSRLFICGMRHARSFIESAEMVSVIKDLLFFFTTQPSSSSSSLVPCLLSCPKMTGNKMMKKSERRRGRGRDEISSSDSEKYRLDLNPRIQQHAINHSISDQ